MADDDSFLRAFEDAAIPREQWHHRDHIRMAYLMLRRHPLEQAILRACSGIRKLNAANGVVDTPTGGYHETMTHAWMRLVHATLCEYGPGATADDFIDAHPQLLSVKALRFYSPERIMSPEAKYAYVEPDLTRLPTSAKGSSGTGSTGKA